MHINCHVPRAEETPCGGGHNGDGPSPSRGVGASRGVVAPWPCAQHIYIDFRAWDWHLGAMRRPPACCYVLWLFNFGSFSSFARPIHFFFIVFCGCTINWAEIASAKLTVSCTLIDFCSVPGPTTFHFPLSTCHIHIPGVSASGEVGLWQWLRQVGGSGPIRLGLFNYGQKSVWCRLKWNFQLFSMVSMA